MSALLANRDRQTRRHDQLNAWAPWLGIFRTTAGKPATMTRLEIAGQSRMERHPATRLRMNA